MKFITKLAFLSTVILTLNSCNSSKNDVSDFTVFIEKFQKDSAFQRKHIDFPVHEYYSDEDFPLDILERDIYEESYTFINFENELPQELRNKNLYEVQINKSKDTVYYQMFGKNNSIDVTYTFQYDKKNYHLVKIEDYTD